MISKEIVEDIVTAYLEQTDCFLVDIQVRPSNIIVVEIDNQEGVDIDTCVALHRHIESLLDREVEDYELEVGSAGITSPFKVVPQYIKNIGNEVEVLAKDGIKHSGVLVAATPENFTIEVTRKVKAEGSKRKVEVTEPIAFGYEEIKYTKYLIRFK